jgi:hypothetical protein
MGLFPEQPSEIPEPEGPLPACPRCGRSDRVVRPGSGLVWSGPFCGRCRGFFSTLAGFIVPNQEEKTP